MIFTMKKRKKKSYLLARSVRIVGGKLPTPGLTTATPMLLRGFVPTDTSARPSLKFDADYSHAEL